MFISGIYALSGDETEGMFATGAVKIKVDNFCLNDQNEEVEFLDGSVNVLPGEEMSFIPKIYNIGSSSYIRAKIVLRSGSTILAEPELRGMSSDFEKIGEYYYYKPALNQGAVINFFEELVIPSALNQNDLNGDFSITVLAEAVQSKNFTPDYSLSDPWHGIEITESTSTEYNTDTDGKVSNVIVKFDNGTSNDIKIDDDFLSSISRLLPGDTLSQTIEIKNSSSKENEYFVSVIPENLTENEEGLLKNVNVKIKTSGGQVLYSGTMFDVKKISLGKYGANQGDTLTVEFYLPSDLDNKYAGLDPKFAWDFAAAEEVPKKSGINPGTGDFKITMAITIFLISAVGLVVVLCLAYKQKKRK